MSAPLPSRSSSEGLAARAFETNNCKYLAKHLRSRVVEALPYCLSNVIGCMNEHNLFRHFNIPKHETGYCRPFPQGTIVQLHEKSFHGDDKGL